MDYKIKDKKKFKVPSPGSNVTVSHSWTVIATVLSFALSVAFSVVTSVFMGNMGLLWAFVVLFAIIAVNILFDIIGTSVQNAEEPPFHSLSSRRVKGAVQSIAIIRHAPQIASICCDIVGDIAGIISGSASAVIVAELVVTFGWEGILPSLLLTGVVGALTIGGKAAFKGFSMKNANSVVFFIGRVANFFKFKG